MRILHIINSLDIGGAQSLLVDLVRNWNQGQRQDQLMIVSLMGKGSLSEKISEMNIPVENLQMNPAYFELKKFIQLVNFIKSFKPDVIQTWLYHSDFLGSIANLFAGNYPIVWGIHHTTPSRDSVKPSTWRVVKILSLLSKILPAKMICCSNSAYQTHLELGYKKGKLMVVFNGVDTNVFIPSPKAKERLRNELNLPVDTKLIGMFARYHPQKDHKNLVDSAKLLLQTNPDVHFVLAGESIDVNNSELISFIRQAGFGDNFHLLGSRNDMDILCAGVDIVTLSSSYGEALPMTLCEGMACGTLCVATDVGDIKELIDDTGVVVSPLSPIELADAWKTIIELPEVQYQQLAQLTRVRIDNHYSIATMIAKYKKQYEIIVNKNEIL